MSSIPTPECPTWCTDHTEDGYDLIHAGAATAVSFADVDATIVARLHRTDEWPFPGHVEVVPGSTFLTLTFRDEGESVRLVLDAEQARLFACQIITMVGVQA